MLFDRDAPPVFETGDCYGVEEALADLPYEGDNIFVGRVYKSKFQCKMKIALHAINRKFHFRTPRSTPQFMVMKSVDRSCHWRVYVVLIDATRAFQIRQATLTHSCTVDTRRHYHRLTTTQVIGEIMQSKFVGVKRGPPPAGIRKTMLDDYHVNISYWKGWHSRELSMEKLYGTAAGSYALLPAYLALLQSANPGTLCYLKMVENPIGGTLFKYCFVAFGASIQGLPFMRRVIVIDGTPMKGKYGGCLVSACVQDANFQIFPVAYGVVDSENDNAWEWFLRKLSEIVEDAGDLVFVSDRHRSIYAGLMRVYPLAHHAACTVHLWRNIRAGYNPKRIAGMMSAAARAYTVSDFKKKNLEIQKLNPGCAAYLVDIGQKVQHNDSNIAESWNAVLKEAREFPLICMLEYIRTVVMTWFAVRRAKAMNYEGTLSPRVRQRVEENYNKSTNLAFRAISPYEFQVQAQNGGTFTVKLLESSCSCMEYQALGIPCVHALAAGSSVNMPRDLLVDSFYYVQTWRGGFQGKIYPVPSVGSSEIGGAFRGNLLPLAVRRPPGKLKHSRIFSRGEFKVLSILHMVLV